MSAQADRMRFLTKVGDTVPHFELTTLDGENCKIEDLRNQVVLISFFGTRCPPCLREMPEIQAQLAEVYDKDELVILSIGTIDECSSIEKFRAKHNYDFNYVCDREQKIWRLFAQSSLPRNVVVDAQGKIIFQSQGYRTATFSKMVSLIAEQLGKDTGE